jgi:adenylylsulfate kinase
LASENVIYQTFTISRQQREAQNGHRGLVVWFCGLSGSGKSTLANALTAELHAKNIRTYNLDGDNIRLGINNDLRFSPLDRAENLRRIAEISKLMADAGLVVTTSFITPLHENRQKIREILGRDYVEIFVDCPLEECERRDVKGLYKKARDGKISDFTGINAPFERPESPDLRLQSHVESIPALVEKLVSLVLPRIKITS